MVSSYGYFDGPGDVSIDGVVPGEGKPLDFEK